MGKVIPPLDLMWLIMESPEGPTHVGALLLFDKPRRRPGIVREVVESYRRWQPTPPYNYVPEFGARVPRFREAPAYDPLYHVRHVALPAGAAYEDLLRLVAELHEPVMDRGRPLFRVWLIDGVPGNRFALYTKTHHSIIDGVSGMRDLRSSLQTTVRRTVPRPAFASKRAGSRRTVPKEMSERLRELNAVAVRQAGALREVSMIGVRKALAGLMGERPAGSRPFTAHRGPMNEPMQMSRSLATLSLPLDDMHSVARFFDATLNDLAVTLVDAGLHAYLRRTGRAFDHRMVAFCPVSLRDDGDSGSGTRASAVFVHLGDPNAAVRQRIGEVVAAMTSAKQEIRALSKDAAMAYAVALLGFAELETATGIDQVGPLLANMVISNVPGGRERLYLAGAPLAGIFPISAIAMSVGLNVTFTSWHDRMDFGFVGNGAVMHDLPLLADCVHGAYLELRAAASKRRRRRN
jgi:WS/DGAT/MGAT family acyltransferase